MERRDASRCGCPGPPQPQRQGSSGIPRILRIGKSRQCRAREQHRSCSRRNIENLRVCRALAAARCPAKAARGRAARSSAPWAACSRRAVRGACCRPLGGHCARQRPRWDHGRGASPTPRTKAYHPSHAQLHDAHTWRPLTRGRFNCCRCRTGCGRHAMLAALLVAGKATPQGPRGQGGISGGKAWLGERHGRRRRRHGGYSHIPVALLWETAEPRVRAASGFPRQVKAPKAQPRQHQARRPSKPRNLVGCCLCSGNSRCRCGCGARASGASYATCGGPILRDQSAFRCMPRGPRGRSRG